MAYTTIDNPELYFQSALWTGNDSARDITLGGSENMQPDLVVSKKRGSNSDAGATWSDVTRGATSNLDSSTSDPAQTDTDGIDEFQADGFGIAGADRHWNEGGQTYVAWCWKAGGSGSANTDGSVNSIKTSANTTSGFSIVDFDLDGESGEETVGHGLGVAPDFVIAKTKYDGAGAGIWWVYHKGLTSASYYLSLSGTDAQTSETQAWGGDAPTSSVFTVGSASGWGTDKAVAYAWHGVKGYSKFGTFTGNGSLDGTFCWTGFRPSFVIIKCSSHASSNWLLLDNKRSNPFNDATCPDALYANDNAAEATASPWIDLLSNGFKCRGYNEGNTINAAGNTYVYMAWAEAPFVNSKGVPANAR